MNSPDPTNQELQDEIEGLQARIAELEQRVSDQEQSEEMIRKLWSAVEQSASVVVITDTDGNIEYVNPKFSDVTGYAVDEVLGKNPRLLKSGQTPDSEYRKLWSSLSSGREWRGELLNRKKNGELYWGSAVISPIRDNAGQVTHYLEVMEDTSERRRLEEALVSVSESERQQIGQELHDVLGQQLTGITLLMKTLEKRLAKESSPFAENLSQITSLAQKAVGETKRLAHGLYPTGIERHGLHAAFDELADTQKRLFGVSCSYEGDELIEIPDNTTALHLYRIAQEATNNAIRHGKARQVRISLLQEDGDTTLCILDDGIGIPDDLAESKGMGLPIMRYRSNLIQSTFSIQRGKEGGTVVTCAMSQTGGIEGPLG